MKYDLLLQFEGGRICRDWGDFRDLEEKKTPNSPGGGRLCVLAIFANTDCRTTRQGSISGSVLFIRLLDAKDTINSFHDIRRDPGGNFRRLHVLMDLLHAAGPGDDRAHERILQTPCQG